MRNPVFRTFTLRKKQRVAQTPTEHPECGPDRQRYFDTTPGLRRETNDCTVIALAESARLSYPEAHSEMKRRGRKFQKGIVFRHQVRVNPIFRTKRLFLEFDRFRGWETKRIRLSTALSRYNRGRFIFTIKGHAFAVVDGVVRDTTVLSPRALVRCVIRVEPLLLAAPSSI